VKTYGKHLVGLVKNEHLHRVGLQESSLNHVLDTAWGTDNDLGTLLKSLHVITDTGTTDTCVALNVHEVTDGDNDLLDLLGQFTGGGENQSLALLDVGVKLLENGDGESSGFSGSRLGLSDNIVALDDWHDSASLNSGWTLETVGIDTSEKLSLEVHGIERINCLVIVGFNLTFWDLLETLISGSHDCGF